MSKVNICFSFFIFFIFSNPHISMNRTYHTCFMRSFALPTFPN